MENSIYEWAGLANIFASGKTKTKGSKSSGEVNFILCKFIHIFSSLDANIFYIYKYLCQTFACLQIVFLTLPSIRFRSMRALWSSTSSSTGFTLNAALAPINTQVVNINNLYIFMPSIFPCIQKERKFATDTAHLTLNTCTHFCSYISVHISIP